MRCTLRVVLVRLSLPAGAAAAADELDGRALCKEGAQSLAAALVLFVSAVRAVAVVSADLASS